MVEDEGEREEGGCVCGCMSDVASGATDTLYEVSIKRVVPRLVESLYP